MAKDLKLEDMYGYCPVCGARGQQRERRLNGDDICEQGHKYPSRNSLSEPKEQKDGE